MTRFPCPYLEAEVELTDERKRHIAERHPDLLPEHWQRVAEVLEAGRRRSRMETKLTFRYDREGDILHIDRCVPYADQKSQELPDEVVARLNPTTGEVENLEVLFFSTRLLRNDLFELPVTASLRLAGGPVS